MALISRPRLLNFGVLLPSDPLCAIGRFVESSACEIVTAPERMGWCDQRE